MIESIDEFKDHVTPIIQKFYPGTSMEFTSMESTHGCVPHYLVDFKISGFDKRFQLRYRSSDKAWISTFGWFSPYSLVPILSAEDSLFNLFNRLADNKHQEIRNLEAQIELARASLEVLLDEATRIGGLRS
jgi:hypothetical protein